MNFKGKVAVITGASSGIGRATAIYFAEHGCQLALTGRDFGNLEKTKTACVQAGLKENEVVTVVGDLRTDDVKSSLISAAIDQLGSIDILINNAGVAGQGPIASTPLSEYHRIMDTNLTAVLALTQLAIPHLITSKGSVVNVSSVAGLRPLPQSPYYCMSKAALDMFTKLLALELAPHGVRVNSVNPALIETEIISRDGKRTPDEIKEFLEQAKKWHPIGRYGQPEEVAKSIAFLVSDLASFSTGNLFKIDGGAEIRAT